MSSRAPAIAPVVAIVGSPNVGKSTLFNRLTGSRTALVADVPGVTRDRQVGLARADARAFIVVDTGGLVSDDALARQVAEQARRALAEADLALFVLDARAGPSAADEAIAARLRACGKPVLLVANKAEGMNPGVASAEFHGLGLGDPCPISARDGDGVRALVKILQDRLPAAADGEALPEPTVRVAVAGRPNVGKSTLINRLLGDERVLTHEQPGTTRDSVYVPFERNGKAYTLIDTAGVRRRARVSGKIEKFSVVKSLQAIEAADVVVFLIDAKEGVTDQDANLLGLVLRAGRALVIGVNKWDGLDAEQRLRVRRGLERKLAFVSFAPLHFISALHGSGVGELWRAVDRAWASHSQDLATPELTRILQTAVARHAPPVVHGRRIKLRYAHQGGRNPPLIVVHGNRADSVPEAYRRYLARHFRDALGLEGAPVRIEFRSGENPYGAGASRLYGDRSAGRSPSKRSGKRG